MTRYSVSFVSAVARIFLLISVLCLAASARATAQNAFDVQFGIGGSYVRAFDGGGYAVAFDLGLLLPLDLLSADHSLAAELWLGSTEIASGNTSGDRRQLLGIGADWRSRIRIANGAVRPYLSIPFHYLWSSIPDRVFPASLNGSVLDTPSSDRRGTASGVALGVGAGCEFWPLPAMGLGAGATVLYQRLYNGAGPPLLLFSIGLSYSTRQLIEVSG